MAVATRWNKRHTFVLASIDEDWTYLTDFPDHSLGIPITAIQVTPASVGDHFIIRDMVGVTASPSIDPEMIDKKCANQYDAFTKYYYGKLYKPSINQSDCSFTASGSVKVIIDIGTVRSVD